MFEYDFAMSQIMIKEYKLRNMRAVINTLINDWLIIFKSKYFLN